MAKQAARKHQYVTYLRTCIIEALAQAGKTQAWLAGKVRMSTSRLSRSLAGGAPLSYDDAITMGDEIGLDGRVVDFGWILHSIHQEKEKAECDDDARAIRDFEAARLAKIDAARPDERALQADQYVLDLRYRQGVTREQIVTIADLVLSTFADLPGVMHKTVFVYGLMLGDLSWKHEALRALSVSSMLPSDWRLSGLTSMAQLLVETSDRIEGIGLFRELLDRHGSQMSDLETGFTKLFYVEAHVLDHIQRGEKEFRDTIAFRKLLAEAGDAFDGLRENRRRDWWIQRAVALEGYLLSASGAVVEGLARIEDSIKKLSDLTAKGAPLERIAPSQGLANFLYAQASYEKGDLEGAKKHAEAAKMHLHRKQHGMQPHIAQLASSLLSRLNANRLEEFLSRPETLFIIQLLAFAAAAIALCAPGTSLAETCH